MIDEKRIKENIEVFSFPRIFGSEAEIKSFNLAKQRLEALNLDVKTQNFDFTNYYSHIYGRIMFVTTFWLIFVLYLNIGGTFQDINLIILVAIFSFLYITSRRPENVKIGKRYRSQNLYTTIESNGTSKSLINNTKNLIFMAHLDSKGQKYDITDRVRIYILWMGSLLITIPLILLKNLLFMDTSLFFYIIGGFFLGINFFAVVRLFQNTTNNHSKGALDNASGIACILDLISFFSHPENRLIGYNCWFLLTGAEECGTMGIRKFYEVVRSNNLKKENKIIINFDSIGTNLDLIKFGLTTHRGFELQDIFLKKAKQNFILNIKTRNVPIGVHTDGYFLFKKGYKGLEFGDWDSYQYLHTVRDTIDKVDVILLKTLCQILIESLQEIDNYN